MSINHMIRRPKTKSLNLAIAIKESQLSQAESSVIQRLG